MAVAGAFDTLASNGYNIERGPLAQLAEQLTLNQQVTGSTPVRLTLREIPAKLKLGATSPRQRSRPWSLSADRDEVKVSTEGARNSEVSKKTSRF